MNKKLIIAIVAVVVVVAAVFGGTALYAKIQNDRAPEELGLSTPTTEASTEPGTSTTTEAADLAGDWTVSDGSQAGYRVDEVLNGQDVTVVGRTDDVDGTLTIDGTELTTADVTVSMTTVATDNSNRDSQFLSILKTDQNPTSTFTLTEPVDISAITSGVASVEAVGDLTIAGVTQSVTVALEAQTTADGVEVSGSIPVTFSDFDVDAPTSASSRSRTPAPSRCCSSSRSSRLRSSRLGSSSRDQTRRQASARARAPKGSSSALFSPPRVSSRTRRSHSRTANPPKIHHWSA